MHIRRYLNKIYFNFKIAYLPIKNRNLRKINNNKFFFKSINIKKLNESK